MSDSSLTFSRPDQLNEHLISNIQGGVIICQFNPENGTSKTVYSEDRARSNLDYLERTKKGNRYQLEYRCFTNINP